ncbi:MAG: bifunctional phosphopantothenoylcysteine decarboxylase/phosphopantothenate--cysteine ligase CoaBC [Xanthomonadales bacterium]|nr:bifunctional phosphopantothenoylcysteine decarboxylase/phosphopantothenate--cysteine ligase CoaBC [Xanthomonadales bacterium]
MPVAATRVLLGIGGGIAAYKSAELVRRLRDGGADVRVVMTASAQQLVGEATFQALSGNPVRTSLWDAEAEAAMGHIELARWADQLLIAPATADLMARLAAGMADDLLTTLVLASKAPLWLAPAMNQQMWAHPATQVNLSKLRARGVSLLGPAVGDQACGDVGPGRMLEPGAIARAVLGACSDDVELAGLAGMPLLVSAGPTFEDIDPVRYLGNRSSGRMGYAIAEIAATAGAKVTLVSGPVSLATPAGVRRIDVRSALDMQAAVDAEVQGKVAFISAAAVADFRPALVSGSKIKKGDAELEVKLVRNPDILAELSQRADRPFLVGFAAETEDVEQHAREKLSSKRLDMIAANRVGMHGSGFESAENALTVYWNGGDAEIALADKRDVARQLLALMVRRIADRDGHNQRGVAS